MGNSLRNGESLEKHVTSCQKIALLFTRNTSTLMEFKDFHSDLPSGELTFCHGKSPFLMGKSTISMAIFNSKLLVHQGFPSRS